MNETGQNRLSASEVQERLRKSKDVYVYEMQRAIGAAASKKFDGMRTEREHHLIGLAAEVAFEEAIRIVAASYADTDDSGW